MIRLLKKFKLSKRKCILGELKLRFMDLEKLELNLTALMKFCKNSLTIFSGIVN